MAQMYGGGKQDKVLISIESGFPIAKKDGSGAAKEIHRKNYLATKEDPTIEY